jgi:hypothetical protein
LGIGKDGQWTTDDGRRTMSGVLLAGTFPDTVAAVDAHWNLLPVKRRGADSLFIGTICFAKANICSDLIIPQIWLTRAVLWLSRGKLVKF